jgi:hypothetical protein
MTWQNILKAGMTKEELIEQLENMEMDYSDEDDASFSMAIRDNAGKVVNKLPQDKLKEYLEKNNELDGSFYDKFYSELIQIIENLEEEEPFNPRKYHRQLFPEEALFWDRA